MINAIRPNILSSRIDGNAFCFQELVVTFRIPAMYAAQESKIIYLRHRHRRVNHLKLYIFILSQIPFFSP